jgi:Zn-dependent peptidase ImmA (M78 family)
MTEQPVSTHTDTAQAFEALFATAQEYFKEFVQILRSYGIEPDPNMELRRSKGMNSYYNLTDGHIYVAIPSLLGGVSKLYLISLKSMFKAESDDEILELFRLLLPRIIAHELGHSLRHRYQQFQKENMWQEEQVANQLAMALIKRKMPPQLKQKVRAVLASSIAKLGEKVEAKDIALDSYRDIIHALNVTEQIGDSTLENIELIRTVFSIDTDALLRTSGQLPDEVVDRIEQRGEVIGYMNEQYTKDAARYVYSHFGWMYFDFLSKQSDYVDEFAVTRLALKPKLLDEINASVVLDRIEIQALFRAYQNVPKGLSLGRRFFYKRYRGALLRRIETSVLNVPGGRVESDLTQLLEMWEEEDADPLNLLELVCPPDLRKLFPRSLSQDAETITLLPQRMLPTDTDKSLWNYFTMGSSDEYVTNTIQRLEILERIPMLQPLPAELQLWLIHRMYRLKLDSGEPGLWMGEKNNDIFILIDGLLEIMVQNGANGQIHHVGLIKPGNLFGEFSFITNDAATATVRAVRPSECYVFKGNDLQPMAFNHPGVLVQMVTSLADKLNRMNQMMVSQGADKTLFQSAGKLIE